MQKDNNYSYDSMIPGRVVRGQEVLIFCHLLLGGSRAWGSEMEAAARLDSCLSGEGDSGRFRFPWSVFESLPASLCFSM